MSQEGRYLRRLIAGMQSGTSITVNADRAIKVVANGTNLADAAMPLDDFITAVLFDTSPPVINTFSGGSILEKGEITLAYNLNFTVSPPSGGTIASIIITSNQGYNSGDIKSGSGAQSGVQAIVLIEDRNETFTITVTSGDGKTANSTQTFTFYNRIYWGVAVAGATNEAFIRALSNNALDGDYLRNFNVNAGTGQYIWSAIPTDYVSSPYIDPPYFFLGTSVPGGMQLISTAIVYTLENSEEELYSLYRSAESGLGSTDVIVSNSPTG
jgi:hypothetical protein